MSFHTYEILAIELATTTASSTGQAYLITYLDTDKDKIITSFNLNLPNTDFVIDLHRDYPKATAVVNLGRNKIYLSQDVQDCLQQRQYWHKEVKTNSFPEQADISITKLAGQSDALKINTPYTGHLKNSQLKVGQNIIHSQLHSATIKKIRVLNKDSIKVITQNSSYILTHL